MTAREFNIKEYLPHVFLFNSLNAEDILAIAQVCALIRPKKNTLIFNQDTPADYFYVVVIGKISIFRVNKHGQEQVIHIHTDNEVVAEAAIFDRLKYPASCKTIKDSTLVKIPRSALINLIMTRPETALKMMSAYSMRLREFVSKVEYLTIVDVKQRILRYFFKNKMLVQGKFVVELNMTKKELAQILGTVPETLSRNLGKLKKDKLIKENQNHFEIIAMDKIHDLIGD
ncbi:MAG: hypothetical protein A2381_07090 [Bdellovibrionales bacterium RIFOXYB1_FULL_37_110]|nr:MAG: hypothetical protein A2417_14965 [Bdellovibrionales bacterium RIFOXYC1_FULL_37_79]OFZ57827.1 MAG: hypothetical protein A2381_07090 [Bdellovibrionales bacterium RIFOXYB1_FULL_37_110]OFZ62793.1 MAG: hypothetical protein A2577_16610 [Bdellovibrionales bacterium RIFOXYD1_FULL_36_51]